MNRNLILKKIVSFDFLICVVILLSTLWLLNLCKSNSFIGVYDSACYASLGKSIVTGNGYKLDLILHPENGSLASSTYHSSSLLHPLLIAGSYLLFGISCFTAKIPNIVIFGIFTLFLYVTIKKLFDAKTGFLATILNLLCFIPSGFILYPWADVPYILLIYLFIYKYSQAISEIGESHTWTLFLAGIIAGLAILQKPSAISIIPFSVFIFFTALCHNTKKIHFLPLMKKIATFYIPLFIVSSPCFIRDKILTGKFYPSDYYSSAAAEYRFGSIPNSFCGTWELEGIPSLKSIIANLGIWYVLKDSLGQVVLGLKSLFIWQDIVPFFILFLFFGYIVFYFREKIKNSEKVFFINYSIFFGMSFLIYTAFAGYEARHIKMFIPFFVVFAARFFGITIDNITANTPSKTRKYLSCLLLVSLLLMYATSMFFTSLKSLKFQTKNKYSESMLSGIEWIKNNTLPNDVIMAYDPYALSFHTQRKTIRTQNLSLEKFLATVRECEVQYVYVDIPTKEKKTQLYNTCEANKDIFHKKFDDGILSIYKITKDGRET